MRKAIRNTLIASALTAMTCQAVAEEQVNIRMSWWGGNGRHQVTLKALDEFHKLHPNIKVKAEYTGWDGHLSRLTTQIAGNTEPDVMQTNWNWLPIFSKDGSGFYDLTKVKDQLDLGQFDPKELQQTTVNGKLNGIPISVTARVFYYNDQTWARSGLSYPKTWEELIAAGNVFKEKLGDQYYPIILEHQDTFALLRSYMTQKYNAEIIDESTKKFAYTEQQWLELFTLYKKLIDSHVIPSPKYFASFGKSNMYEMKPWINGEWAGTYMWNSTITKYSDNLVKPAKLVLGPYPMLAEAKDAGLFFKPAQMLSIGKNTKYPKESAMLINFLLNSKEGVEALGLERGVPLSAAAVKQLRESGVINDSDPAVAGLSLALSLPHEMKTSPYFDDPQIVALFGDVVQSIDYGHKTVAEAAKYFNQQGDRILRRAMR